MMAGKSAWKRAVELTVAAGGRLLPPVERFIRKRSLVGQATFFDQSAFPWIAHIERNVGVIQQELRALLHDREALPNFQDISKDQVAITDDDRWKTCFLYGCGFQADVGVQQCPRTAELMRQIPGMTTAMFSILSPRKHIRPHRGPYMGVLRYHLGLVVPEDAHACRIRVGEDVPRSCSKPSATSAPGNSATAPGGPPPPSPLADAARPRPTAVPPRPTPPPPRTRPAAAPSAARSPPSPL